MSLKSIICNLLRHNWMQQSLFTGGITYRCSRCEKIHISFCNCPSYTTSDDMELFKNLGKKSDEAEI